MDIELGKTYVTRSGVHVRIIAEDADSTFPYSGDNHETYTAAGTVWSNADDDNDLIAPEPNPQAIADAIFKEAAKPADADKHDYRRDFIENLLLDMVRKEGYANGDEARRTVALRDELVRGAA